MVNRFAVAGVAAAALVACAAFETPADAGNVAWGVTVGEPGFAVSAGQPGYAAWGAPYYAPVVPVPYAPAVAVVPPVVYPTRTLAPSCVLIITRAMAHTSTGAHGTPCITRTGITAVTDAVSVAAIADAVDRAG